MLPKALNLISLNIFNKIKGGGRNHTILIPQETT